MLTSQIDLDGVRDLLGNDSNKTPPSELCDEGGKSIRETTDKQTRALNTPKKIQIAARFNGLIGISKEDIYNLQDIDKLML